jgi:hypothetical protein
LTEVTTLPELSTYAAAAQNLIDQGMNWGKLKTPTSCSCDEETGMHGEFDISGWVTPACSSDLPYQYRCCEPVTCDLSGAVLQF